jgi:hypothetical protein
MTSIDVQQDQNDRLNRSELLFLIQDKSKGMSACAWRRQRTMPRKLPRSKRMSIQAIIFDVDGTLADTEDGHRIAFNRAFAERGLDWVWDVPLYDQLLAVTGGKERIRYYLQDFNPGFAKTRRL